MGATASIITAVSTGAKIGAGFAQQQQDAQGASLRGRFANAVAERNAQLAERQGQDALARGELAANRVGGQTDQAVSSGRAAAAAGGSDVNVGSAAAVTASERLVGAVDALTIRNNAAREAWGYNVEAANQRMQGRLALLSGENQAARQRLASYGTLLSGAADIYSLRSLRVPRVTTGATGPGAALPAGTRDGGNAYGGGLPG